MAKHEVDKDLIRTLAALMDETGLCEIEIENDDDRLRLVRATAAAAPVAVAPIAPIAMAAAAAPAPAGDADLSKHPGALLSPIVGTAYHAASPDAAPFVAIGDRVSAGQTVLVIEAMKTFNEIPSPSSGVVSQILFDNATPVEYGDVLMIIE